MHKARMLKFATAALLVLALAPSLLAGTKSITAIGTSAIDTLTFTVEGNDGTIAAANLSKTTDTIFVAGGSAASVILDSLMADSAQLAPFVVKRINSNKVRFLPPDHGNVTRIRIRNTELITVIVRKGVTYTHVREEVPGLEWYALAVLALLAATVGWWFIRRRKPAVVQG